MSRAFESLTVGRWQLPQRFVMAPLTRNRAGAGHAPTVPQRRVLRASAPAPA